MKATIYINRHIQSANKKNKTDNPAIAVHRYKESVYCKQVEFTRGAKLIQNAEKARCSGATIWIEAEYESLILHEQTPNN